MAPLTDKMRLPIPELGPKRYKMSQESIVVAEIKKAPEQTNK